MINNGLSEKYKSILPQQHWGFELGGEPVTLYVMQSYIENTWNYYSRAKHLGEKQEKVCILFILKREKEKKKRRIYGFAEEKSGEKLFHNIDMLKNWRGAKRSSLEE